MAVAGSLKTLFLLLIVAGCSVGSDGLTAPSTTSSSPPPTSTAVPGEPACPVVVDSERLGRVQNEELTEISGLAASAMEPGLLWAHNDSEGDAAVYAIGADGSDLGKFVLEGVDNRDWEDMAAWTDPATQESWLYVGDIGDNVGQWESILVHRVPEPILGESSVVAATAVETFEFTYPDGPHDAETLLVDPGTGDITIVTKADSEIAQVFEAPGAVPGTTMELTESGTLDLSFTPAGLPTAGDYLGEFVLIRTYLAVLAYPVADGAWWDAEPCELDAPFEIQGEAIATAPDGGAYVTVSEGRRPRVNRTAVG